MAICFFPREVIPGASPPCRHGPGRTGQGHVAGASGQMCSASIERLSPWPAGDARRGTTWAARWQAAVGPLHPARAPDVRPRRTQRWIDLLVLAPIMPNTPALAGGEPPRFDGGPPL